MESGSIVCGERAMGGETKARETLKQEEETEGMKSKNEAAKPSRRNAGAGFPYQLLTRVRVPINATNLTGC